LRVDRAVRIAFAELTFGVAHGFAGAAELIRLALSRLTLLPLLAGLVLAEPFLAHLLEQLAEAIAQRLLVLAQIAELILVALLALLTLLALLAALTLLAALAALILTLAEGAVAQLLLLADHVAELVEHRHHVVV